MFHIVLYQPEIPPNTGNIIRLCANTGAHLHLIKPLGFDFSHRKLKRAGLDYHEFAQVKIYDSFDEFSASSTLGRLYMCSTKAAKTYSECNYHAGDMFMFGPETRGIPEDLLFDDKHQAIKIPMLEHSRSINLSNAVSIILFEAWRQNAFKYDKQLKL